MGILLKLYWKQIIIAIALSIAAYLVFNKIYNMGYAAANIECAQRMKEYSDKLDSRIAELEVSSSKLAAESKENSKSLKKDFTAILLTIKGKPLYTIEQGVCKPSPDFVKAYNDAVDRANK